MEEERHVRLLTSPQVKPDREEAPRASYGNSDSAFSSEGEHDNNSSSSNNNNSSSSKRGATTAKYLQTLASRLISKRETRMKDAAESVYDDVGVDSHKYGP